MTTRRLSSTDALLLLMVLIWGTNYSIVKYAFLEIDPQAFNAVRMVIASAVFLSINVAMRGRERASSVFRTPAVITRRDWAGLAALGVIGHCTYQYCFVGGLARTTVANSSLLLAATPVLIAAISAVLGQERIGPLHWFGGALSLTGIYIVVGRGMSIGGPTMHGDVLMIVAVFCWAVYTMGAQPLIARHSPVGVTGLSMAIGTVLYVPIALPHLLAVDWTRVSWTTWVCLVYSALFALCVAYTIWYVGVREIGSARTSVYSNLIPIVAMLTAVVFLGEHLSGPKALGAALVIGGVALTRVGARRPPLPPAEE